MDGFSRAFESLTNGTAFAFGGIGLVLTVTLLVLLRLLLPPLQRRQLRTPTALVVLYVAFVVLAAIARPETTTERVLDLLGLFVLLVVLGRLSLLFLVDAVLSRRLPRPVPKIFRDILLGLVYAMAILMTLRGAGAELDSLLTTSALLTAVIGLSMQDTLGNVFAGLAIQAERPFEVGDWIQYANQSDHIGRVIEINWRATKVVTLDEVEIIIPNGPLAKAPLRNFTKPTPIARRSVRVTVPFRHSPATVQKAVMAALSDIPGMLTKPAPSVLTEDFGERGIGYWVRYFTDDFTRREQIDSRIRDLVWYALQRAGIEIAIPVYSVGLRQHDADGDTQVLSERIDQRTNTLRQIDFLQSLSPQQLRTLAERSHERMFAPGEIVIREGDPGDELFIVQSGEVAIVLRKDHRHTVEVARLGPGSFFGEMSLMTGEQRTATVRTTTEARLLVVRKIAFQEILEAVPRLAERISEILAHRQEELEQAGSRAQQSTTTTLHERRGLILERIKQFFSL